MNTSTSYKDIVMDVVAATTVPVLLAGWDRAASGVTLHVGTEGAARQLRRELKRSGVSRASDAKWEVKATPEAALERQSSMEGVADEFRHDEYWYDPLCAFSRVRNLVAGVRAARSESGSLVAGVYYASKTRTLHAVLNTPSLRQRNENLMQAAETVYSSLQVHLASRLGPQESLPVMVTWRVPAGSMVPVDALSFHGSAHATQPNQRAGARWPIAAGVAALLSLGFGSPASAEGPAVSEINGKVDVGGGTWDGDQGTVASGSLSAPVTKSTGLQIDGSYGQISADEYWGVGGHYFLRDPEKGLIGLIGSHQKLGKLALGRAGIEGEYYLDKFQLRATTGYQWGDVKNGAFVTFGARFYPTDNLAIEAVTECNVGSWLQRLGFEYSPGFSAVPGLSVFAEGAVGESNYDRWIAGVRYYFGPQKSLKLRHRQDDPDNLLPDGMSRVESAMHASEDRPVARGGGGGGGGGYDGYK